MEGWPQLHRAGYSIKGNAFYRDFFHPPPDSKSEEKCLPNRGSEPTETRCTGLLKDHWFQWEFFAGFEHFFAAG